MLRGSGEGDPHPPQRGRLPRRAGPPGSPFPAICFIRFPDTVLLHGAIHGDAPVPVANPGTVPWITPCSSAPFLNQGRGCREYTGSINAGLVIPAHQTAPTAIRRICGGVDTNSIVGNATQYLSFQTCDRVQCRIRRCRGCRVRCFRLHYRCGHRRKSRYWCCER